MLNCSFLPEVLALSATEPCPQHHSTINFPSWDNNIYSTSKPWFIIGLLSREFAFLGTEAYVFVR